MYVICIFFQIKNTFIGPSMASMVIIQQSAYTSEVKYLRPNQYKSGQVRYAMADVSYHGPAFELVDPKLFTQNGVAFQFLFPTECQDVTFRLYFDVYASLGKLTKRFDVGVVAACFLVVSLMLLIQIHGWNEYGTCFFIRVTLLIRVGNAPSFPTTFSRFCSRLLPLILVIMSFIFVFKQTINSDDEHFQSLYSPDSFSIYGFMKILLPSLLILFSLALVFIAWLFIMLLSSFIYFALTVVNWIFPQAGDVIER